MTDCIFCKIINKEVPADLVFEDPDTIAFLDIKPSSLGHTLVVSKEHVKTLDELPDAQAQSLMLTIKKLTKALLKENQGCNIIQNNNSVAGQIVDHVHFHVVPRNEGDGLQLNFGVHKEFSGEEKKNVIETIKKNI